jgi:putative PIN family toxin of toxin-antitoxin system
MKIVIDTNVLLVSISSRSPWHPIFLALLQGNYSLCVTTDILNEYAEIIEEQMGNIASKQAMQIIESLPNIEEIKKYYFWRLITKDPDDNKFVDCYVAANADFLVTDDKDLAVYQM